MGVLRRAGCEGIACQQDEFHRILTEPDGLNWLARFAAHEGKPIVLPEWGLGVFNPTDLNGTYQDEELGGGDDPTFIDDMAAWIDAHHVFEASYWDFEPETLSVTPLERRCAAERLRHRVVDVIGHGQDVEHWRLRSWFPRAAERHSEFVTRQVSSRGTSR